MDASRSHPFFRSLSRTGSRWGRLGWPRTMAAGLAVITALLITALLLVAPALSVLWSGAPGAEAIIAASAIDPGSDRIAFVRLDQEFVGDIWVMDADGTN